MANGFWLRPVVQPDPSAAQFTYGDVAVAVPPLPLSEAVPPVENPDAEEIRKAIPIPEVRDDLPGVSWMLDQFLKEPIDPWDLKIPMSDEG